MAIYETAVGGVVFDPWTGIFHTTFEAPEGLVWRTVNDHVPGQLWLQLVRRRWWWRDQVLDAGRFFDDADGHSKAEAALRLLVRYARAQEWID